MSTESATAPRTSYGKPVAGIATPTDGPLAARRFELDDCADVLTATSTGAVVHRAGHRPLLVITDAYNYGGRTPATYRDDTVVPFHAYYDSVTLVEVFGPDITV